MPATHLVSLTTGTPTLGYRSKASQRTWWLAEVVEATWGKEVLEEKIANIQYGPFYPSILNFSFLMCRESFQAG